MNTKLNHQFRRGDLFYEADAPDVIMLVTQANEEFLTFATVISPDQNKVGRWSKRPMEALGETFFPEHIRDVVLSIKEQVLFRSGDLVECAGVGKIIVVQVISDEEFTGYHVEDDEGEAGTYRLGTYARDKFERIRIQDESDSDDDD